MQRGSAMDHIWILKTPRTFIKNSSYCASQHPEGIQAECQAGYAAAYITKSSCRVQNARKN